VSAAHIWTDETSEDEATPVEIIWATSECSAYRPRFIWTSHGGTVDIISAIDKFRRSKVLCQ